MIVDKEIIYRHLDELKSAVLELSRLKSISLAEYESDTSVRWQVERSLQIAIQNLLDIASHILSALGKNRYETYAEVIEGLAKGNIIPDDFADRIRGMTGLRNILVHDYLAIDNGIVFRILRDQLTDFDEFAGHAIEYIDRGDEDAQSFPG